MTLGLPQNIRENIRAHKMKRARTELSVRELELKIALLNEDLFYWANRPNKAAMWPTTIDYYTECRNLYVKELGKKQLDLLREAYKDWIRLQCDVLLVQSRQ